jgi:hypothetical protein
MKHKHEHEMHSHHSHHSGGHHSGHHSDYSSGGMHSGHGIYKNEVEKPEMAAPGHLEHGMGCMSFKEEAMGIAMGQAGREGCKSDESKIHAQFKDYHWSGSHGHAD